MAKMLTITVKDDEGKEWGSFAAPAKTFSTGSTGFYGNAKLIDPSSVESRYQVGMNIILIGSNPDKAKAKKK